MYGSDEAEPATATSHKERGEEDGRVPFLDAPQESVGEGKTLSKFEFKERITFMEKIINVGVLFVVRILLVVVLLILHLQ